MTAARPSRSRRVLDSSTVRPPRGSGAAALSVVPVAGTPSLVLDVDVLRQRLGAWITTQLPAARPGVEVLWRESTLMCDGIVALARATLGVPDSPLWLIDVRLSPDLKELTHWTGLPNRSLQHTVEVLVGAEVLDGVSQVGRERVVRVRPDVLADAPVLAAVDWDVVRHRLGDADGPIARLLVRELARRTTSEARRQGHFISVSQRELAEAVGYSKASMRRHLDLLAATGVIVSRSRDRANSWHRLQTVAFGGDVDAPAARRSADRAGPALTIVPADDRASDTERAPTVLGDLGPLGEHGARPTKYNEHAAPERRVTSPSPGSAVRSASVASMPTTSGATAHPVESALTVEVNGVRVAIPPGVELTLEQDASGAFWYRAGALRLGPVRFG